MGSKRRLTAVVLALTVLTAACSDDGDDGEPSPATTTESPTSASASSSSSSGSTASTATSSSSTSATGASTGSTASTATTAIPGPAFVDPSAKAEASFPGTNTPAVLTDVRVAGHDGYDRVVFTFRDSDQLPGFLVDYMPLPITADPSDLPLTIRGTHALVVRMQAASRFRFDDTATLVYTGPSTVRGDTTVVTEAVFRGDFEMLLSWAVGVTTPKPFRVFTLTGPPRVVVDVKTGA